MAVGEQAVKHGPCVMWANMLLCARSKVTDLFLLLRKFFHLLHDIVGGVTLSFVEVSGRVTLAR